MTSLALACIYAGYKLFCGLPALNRGSRIGVLLLNVIPGILLALIGTGLLAAQVHNVVSHASVARHHRYSSFSNRNHTV